MTNAVITGGPAFPLQKDMALEPVTDMGGRDVSSGMTLRDYFAGQALVGVIAGLCSSIPNGVEEPNGPRAFNRIVFEHAAKDAYTLADAMLAARKTGDA